MRNPEAANIQLPNVKIIKLDVNDVAQIHEVVKQLEHPVDVVMNNAGYVLMGPLEGLSDEQIVQQVTTNLLGTIRITQAFLPYFRERGKGLFLNVTSTAALLPDPFMAVYAATKAAVEAWSTSMRSELSKVGVSIKTLIPDLMNTSLVTNAQLALHPAYQQWTDKMLAKFSTPGAMAFDDPAKVAEFVYNAATDESDKLHYLVGNNAINTGVAIEENGVDAMLAYKENFLFS